MRVVDLFSGLGGFSEAFVDRGHDVERYEFDERFSEVPYTTIKNVLDLTPVDIDHADIILASPPCNRFSLAAVSKTWPKGEPTEKTLEAIALVRHAVYIIKEANPKYWLLENPRGMIVRVLGRPSMVTWWGAWGTTYKKETYIYGELPPIDRRMLHKYLKVKRGEKAGVQDPNLSPAERALIPYDFSLAVCLAAEGNSAQTTLYDHIANPTDLQSDTSTKEVI